LFSSESSPDSEWLESTLGIRTTRLHAAAPGAIEKINLARHHVAGSVERMFA